MARFLQKFQKSVCTDLQICRGMRPLGVRDEVDKLVKQKPDDTDSEPDHAHHQPTIPIQPL